ncbi:hypothetical protein, partial [Streptomyces bacillaris]|uniref:hypothetical protein n=1 Tax=Streptomyces bacillaris TaxID=68179 RepID=UPI0037F64280
MVIRDGRVYDGWTDRYGEPIDVYRSRFEYGEYLRFDPLRVVPQMIFGSLRVWGRPLCGPPVYPVRARL